MHARRLVTQDKVVAIGGTNYSSLNIAARPIIQEAQVSHDRQCHHESRGDRESPTRT
jgi:hypothetical protein